MTADIIKKLTALLTKGIETEAEVVYLLVGIRKLLEQQDAKKQYEYLTFHCDWVLHPELEGTTAQRVLKSFDAANAHLRAPARFESLPDELQREVTHITTMAGFQHEIDNFLTSNGLSTVDTMRPEGWAHFIHLYSRVIEDCPLVIKMKDQSASIVSVTLRVEHPTQPPEENVLFRVIWSVLDKNGKSGNFWVAYSFSQNPRPTIVQAGQGKQ